MGDKNLVSTGLETLDDLLGGGIPRRQSVIITGDPGVGKTILCSQIAFAQAARGENAVLVTITSEPHDKLLTELQGFSFYDQEKIGNELFIFSAYPYLVKGPNEARDVLLKTVRDRQARLLFVDGLRSLRDLWGDESQIRKFLYDVGVGLAQTDCIGLFTTEYPLERLLSYPEATTVDGIIALSMRSFEERRVRRIQVVKLRGRRHVEGEHLVHITPSGLEIVRRLETRVGERRTQRAATGRLRTGLPELDNLLGGGLPIQSATLVAGSTGIGKTLMALHFAAQASADERALFVSYGEPVDKLVARAAGVGLRLDAAISAGWLRLLYRCPVELEADDLAAEILREVDGTGVRRLVVDGIGELQASLTTRERARGFLTALVECLRNRGVTTVFVKEIPKITGVELDFSDTPLAVTAENLLFLRHLELRGKLHRIISILKLREGPADEHLREFVIDESGIRVLGPLESVEGLLTGLGRPLGPHRPRGET